MNDPSRLMNRNYGIWQPPIPPPPVVEDSMGFGSARPAFSGSGGMLGCRINWKGKKLADRRKKLAAAAAAAAAAAVSGGGGGGVPGAGFSGYKPPALSELQSQNRAKAFRFYPKKKFARFAPFAPRNTTSFIIRAKKAGGIASLVSPCPVTPAILPTPRFSPSREDLVDMAKEEWGVDGYGSMKGLIRLRPPPAHEMRGDEDDDAEDGSSESDVEEHVEMERRLDHDLSRFEMVYPQAGEEHGAAGYLLENRVDDQDAHIAQLEEENLTLKERLFLMESEIGDLRRRLQLLETHYRPRGNTTTTTTTNNKNDNDNMYDANANNIHGSINIVGRLCPKWARRRPLALAREATGATPVNALGALTGVNALHRLSLSLSSSPLPLILIPFHRLLSLSSPSTASLSLYIWDLPLSHNTHQHTLLLSLPLSYISLSLLILVDPLSLFSVSWRSDEKEIM